MLITFTTVTHTPPQPLHDGHNDHNSDMLNNAKSGDSYKKTVTASSLNYL